MQWNPWPVNWRSVPLEFSAAALIQLVASEEVTALKFTHIPTHELGSVVTFWAFLRIIRHCNVTQVESGGFAISPVNSSQVKSPIAANL